MSKNKLTQENLLKLGFKQEFVSAEESGDEAFSYFVYEVKNALDKERCVLISNELESGDLYVEFFEMQEIGIFDDFDVLAELIEVLKKAK